MSRSARTNAEKQQKINFRSNPEDQIIHFDPRKIFQEFEVFVLQDIKQFGKPAYCYSYHHESKVFNTFDLETQFTQEMTNLESHNFSFTHVNHDITISNTVWSCDIVIARPLDNLGRIDMSKFKGLTVDPLGNSLGFFTMGFYYVKFPQL